MVLIFGVVAYALDLMVPEAIRKKLKPMQSWSSFPMYVYTYTPSLQAVDAKYAEADAIVGPLQEVAFEGEITLDIPKEGLVLESGWSITPHTHPGVSLFYNTIHVSVCYCRCSN